MASTEEKPVLPSEFFDVTSTAAVRFAAEHAMMVEHAIGVLDAARVTLVNTPRDPFEIWPPAKNWFNDRPYTAPLEKVREAAAKLNWDDWEEGNEKP